MIDRFWETINTQDFDETGFLDVISVKKGQKERALTIKLMLQMGIISEPGVELTEYWNLSLQKVQVNSVSIGYAQKIELLENHCLLWRYEQPQRSLVLIDPNLECLDIEMLIGRLYLKHQELVNQWMPFDIRKLLTGAKQMISAPESLILSYTTIFDEFEIKYSSYISSEPKWYDYTKGWINGYKKFKLLAIDSSYIVASELSAKCLSSYCASFE